MPNSSFKAGFASIVGRPSVGKSTLMNTLIGQKIAITSSKPQTTRNRIRTVYTDDNAQIVFVDTPGMTKAKNKLGTYMASEVTRSFSDVDVVLWLVEASDYVGPGDKKIAERLKGINLPIILVINKIDKVKKDDLFHIIDVYRQMCDFAEVVPVSALKKTNTDILLEQIIKYLPYGDPFFDEDTVTDQPERQIVAEIIREKALKCLDEEIPHGIAVTIESMKYSERIANIEATIICERDSHKGIIIGKGGTMLKKIGSAARYEIEDLIQMQANLKLWVKVKKDWRDSDVLLKNFGYEESDE